MLVILNFVYPLESTVSVDDQSITESAVAAGCNNREYLELAKKGGGHQGNCSDLYFPFLCFWAGGIKGFTIHNCIH